MAHLIFVCKYRKKLLIQYGDQIKKILEDATKEKDIKIIEMEIDKNHIHLLIRFNPHNLY